MLNRSAAVVVAFDGLIADTLDLRATAVVEGLAAAGLQANHSQVREMIAGRTIDETLRALAITENIADDETLIDIASHRAQRVCSHLLQEPVMLREGAAHWLQRAASRMRIVVRSDSLRQHVEPLLDASGLTMFVSMLRCSDDASATTSRDPVFVQAWEGILDRLHQLSVVSHRVHGLECASVELCSLVAAARVRRVMSVTEASVDELQLF